MRSLESILGVHSGKVVDKWSSYIDAYESWLSPFKERPVRILEIGIQNGGSLEIWNEYFPNAELIIGCDILKSCGKLTYAADKIQVVVGDANSSEAIAQITNLSPTFDIIIDDGSHTSSDIVKSFSHYFGLLKPDGIYIAEDLHCSYWESFQGGLRHPMSSMSFFKKLVDLTNFEHWGTDEPGVTFLSKFQTEYGVQFSEAELRKILSIEFRNSLCKIVKTSGADTTLGRRIVVGQEATVWPGALESAGHPPLAFDQRKNPWSAHEDIGNAEVPAK